MQGNYRRNALYRSVVAETADISEKIDVAKEVVPFLCVFIEEVRKCHVFPFSQGYLGLSGFELEGVCVFILYILVCPSTLDVFVADSEVVLVARIFKEFLKD